MTKANQKVAPSGANAMMMLATKTKKPAAAKTDDKEVVLVTDPTVAAAIKTYTEKKKEIDIATGDMETASGIIKEAGKKIWIDEVTKTTRAKESFILSNGEQSTLFYVQDAYKRANLDEERVQYLKDTYGEDIIGTENKFVINAELIDKYGQILCEFIQKSKLIEDEDKNNLIQLEQKHVIAKGTINRLSDIAKKVKTTVEAIFEEILPTVALKVRGDSKKK
jgi:hypothetical protein